MERFSTTARTGSAARCERTKKKVDAAGRQTSCDDLRRSHSIVLSVRRSPVALAA